MSKALIKQKYEFNEDDDPISSGTFGQVYIIRDKKVKTEYILKKIRKIVPNNLNVIGTDFESFENEINFLINVKGTNIINIIDYYSNDNNKFYYIILEKMDGDLETMLKANYKNGMSSKMIRKIFKQLNSGLKIMNKEKKSHRDLKPSNILYSYTNDDKTDFIIKLGDFGLSTDLYKTEVRSNAGTNIFKAPEVEDEIYSNKCDLYSIGVILYMLKTGEIIFEGKKLVDILINKINGKLKKKTNDDKLDDLISKLVVNNPEKRLNWNDYFNHPFFKVKDDDNNDNFNQNKSNEKLSEIKESKKDEIIQKLIVDKKEMEQKINNLIKNKEEIEKKYNEMKNKNNDLIKNEEELMKKINELIKNKQEVVQKNNNIEDSLDSLIIKNKNDIKLIKNWINPNKEFTFKLLYRATRDGDSYNDFHSKCKDAPNISFIKTNEDIIIGGYTTIPWICENNSYISDKDAFIFSMHSKEKYSLKNDYKGKCAIYHDDSSYCCCYGYCGEDLAIKANFLNKNNSYVCGNKDYWSFDTNNLEMIGKDIKGQVNIIISELEVFKICYQKIMDSIIINDENVFNMLKNWINPNVSMNFELLYRGTRDGDSVNNFYLKCEYKSPTISIIKTEKGKIIGGYTTIPWINENISYISDENTFIFSVDSKEKYNVKKKLNGKNAVYHSSSWCCCFGYCGNDLAVGDKFLQGNNSYCCGNGDNYYSFETTNNKMFGTSNIGKIEFKISELEIFKINYTK